MNARSTKVVRCAIYTRVSTDQGLSLPKTLSIDSQSPTNQNKIVG